MLKIFLILILMMMLVWILFQYWNQLVCNTLFTSKIIRKCFLKLVHTWCRVYTMLKTILIFLTLFTIFRTKDESFIFNLFQLVSIHCDWYYSICTFGKLFFSHLSIRKSISRKIYINHLPIIPKTLPNVHCFSVKNQKYKK